MTLLEVIALTFAYYHRGQPLQDAVLKMYASDLADLDQETCIAAYERYRRDPKNKTFPLPAQIRELVHPEQFVSVEARAREIAARIVGSIANFGWCNGRDAEAHIGPEGWAAVTRAGGWSYLCENVGTRISATTLQAQLRDQLEGSLKYGSDTLDRAIQAPEQKRGGELESAGSALARLLSGAPKGTTR